MSEQGCTGPNADWCPVHPRTIEAPMTAPSGGRDVLAERLAEAWHDDLTKNGLVCHHSMINGREDPPEAYIECLNVAEGMIAALGPDAGPMRRALGDGAVVVDRERLVTLIEQALAAGIRKEHRRWAEAIVNSALPGPDATGGA